MDKKILLFIFTFITFIIFAEEVTVKIGINNAPPYRIIKNGKYSGIYVEIIEKTFVGLNYKIEFVEQPLARLWKSLENGNIDMMLGPNKLPDRVKFAYYLEKAPLPREKKLFFIGSPDKKIESYKDLSNLSIGILIGNTYNTVFDRDSSLDKYQIDNVTRGFLMVVSGRLDCFIAPEKEGDYIIKVNNMKLYKSGFGFEGELSYVIISRESSLMNKSFIIENKLKEITNSKEIDNIIRKYR